MSWKNVWYFHKITETLRARDPGLDLTTLWKPGGLLHDTMDRADPGIPRFDPGQTCKNAWDTLQGQSSTPAAGDEDQDEHEEEGAPGAEDGNIDWPTSDGGEDEPPENARGEKCAVSPRFTPPMRIANEVNRWSAGDYDFDDEESLLHSSRNDGTSSAETITTSKTKKRLRQASPASTEADRRDILSLGEDWFARITSYLGRGHISKSVHDLQNDYQDISAQATTCAQATDTAEKAARKASVEMAKAKAKADSWAQMLARTQSFVDRMPRDETPAMELGDDEDMDAGNPVSNIREMARQELQRTRDAHALAGKVFEAAIRQDADTRSDLARRQAEQEKVAAMLMEKKEELDLAKLLAKVTRLYPYAG